MKSATYPHVEWLDLHGNGQLYECAILKRDNFGNVYFITLRDLDMIDKRRLAGILSNRNAASVELFELLSQMTLGNGVNALEYFHQLVKVRSAAGVISRPEVGRVGAPGVIQAAPQAQAVQAEAPVRRAPPAAKK